MKYHNVRLRLAERLRRWSNINKPALVERLMVVETERNDARRPGAFIHMNNYIFIRAGSQSGDGRELVHIDHIVTIKSIVTMVIEPAFLIHEIKANITKWLSVGVAQVYHWLNVEYLQASGKYWAWPTKFSAREQSLQQPGIFLSSAFNPYNAKMICV